MMPELHFDQFADKLQTLADVVVDLSCTRSDLDVTIPMFYEVGMVLGRHGHIATDYRDFFKHFAIGLLEMDGGDGLLANHSFVAQCKQLNYDHAKDIEDADYIEYLTATSLALYFLGVPFSHPWDRVLDKVEVKTGGLPNGACVAKTIGEIIRFSRIANRRYRAGQRNGLDHAGETDAGKAATAIAPLLVYSHMPVILHQSYVQTPEVKGCLPPAAHLLGHCYELLQMRLYASEGLPFRYFVPSPLVKAKLQAEAGDNLDHAWLAALDWLFNHVFQTEHTEQYVVLTGTEALPPVFLNGTSGLFTSPRPPEGTPPEGIPAPLPATFMRKMRVLLYRASLMKLPVTDTHNLLTLRHKTDNERLQARDDVFQVYARSIGANQPPRNTGHGDPDPHAA